MDTKLCPFCLHSNEDWEDWLYFCIRGCLPKNLFRNVLASKWHLSLKCPNGLSVGKWNQEVVCHNLKKKRTKLVLRNIWRRVFFDLWLVVAIVITQVIDQCCFCIVFTIVEIDWKTVRTFFYLFSHPLFLLYMIVLISVTFYTKPDKTTKEPESPKCCGKLFDGDFLVFVKRQLTFWLTFSSLSIGVKKSSIFCWHSA